MIFVHDELVKVQVVNWSLSIIDFDEIEENGHRFCQIILNVLTLLSNISQSLLSVLASEDKSSNTEIIPEMGGTKNSF